MSRLTSITVWRLFKFKALAPIALEDIRRALLSARDHAESTIVDRAGAEPVRAIRRVEVRELGDRVLVRVGFRAKKVRLRGEEFEVKISAAGSIVEVMVRRIKGIGRVSEDYIASIISRSLPLMRLKSLRGGLLVAIEGGESPLRSTHLNVLVEWLGSLAYDCRGIPHCAENMGECLHTVHDALSEGCVVVCGGYLASAAALYGYEPPRTTASIRLPDVAAVALSGERSVDKLVISACIKMYGYPLVLRGDVENSHEELRSVVLEALKAREFSPL